MLLCHAALALIASTTTPATPVVAPASLFAPARLELTLEPPPIQLEPIGSSARAARHTWLDQPDGAAAPRTDGEEFGSLGHRRFYVQGAVATDIQTTGNLLGLGGVGWESFLAQNISLNVELNGMGISQEGPDAAAFNVAVLLRWYFHEAESWAAYLDFGAGVLIATNEVPNFGPENGSNFNFTPQAGMGVSIALQDAARLMVGARWHHISNANLYEENSGRDNILGYVGLSVPF